MAYIITDLNDNMITSGQTRDQLKRGIESLQLDIKALPRLPRYGRELIIANPLPRPSYIIKAA